MGGEIFSKGVKKLDDDWMKGKARVFMERVFVIGREGMEEMGELVEEWES